MRRQRPRHALARLCERLGKISIRLPRRRHSAQIEQSRSAPVTLASGTTGMDSETKFNRAHPYIRRAASFQLTHHTPRSTPIKHEAFLDAAGARALNDFTKCVVERDSRVHLDWAHKWSFALDANQKQIIDEYRAYLASKSPNRSFIDYHRPAMDASAATITIEQLIQLRAQATEAMSAIDDADKQYYINRFNTVVQQARQCLFYILAKREPEYFAALTEICNKDSGPVGIALGKQLEQLMLVEFKDSPLCVDKDRDEVLVTRNDTGIQFEIMTVVIHTTATDDESKPEAAYIHIQGRYDARHRLHAFEAKHRPFDARVWRNFQQHVTSAHTAWHSQEAIVTRLNDSERHAVIRHCSSRHSIFRRPTATAGAAADTGRASAATAAVKSKVSVPAFAGVTTS